MDTTVSTSADDIRDWYFTFGLAHTHPVTGEPVGQCYVVIHDTFAAAYRRMTAAFGSRWAFQYEHANASDLPSGEPGWKAAGVDEFGLRQIPLPTTVDQSADSAVEAAADEYAQRGER